MLSAISLLTVAVRGADGWAQLKPGMTRAEMTTALGEPLMRSSGRQFELCIYDAGAEVLCYRGTVVAWTAPSGSTAPDGRQIDLSRLLQPAAVEAPKPKAYVPRSERGAGYEPIAPRRTRFPRL